jgi:phage head maturation protease
MKDKITKAFSSEVTANEGERAVTVWMSTTAVDRDGEVLIPQGCNSKNFERNPVVMWDHVYLGRLPVGQCVAIKREENGLKGKIIFAERPENHPVTEEWLPDTLLSLYRQKVMRAVSVGLVPIESRPATDRDVKQYGDGCRRVYSKWELLELSCTAIPANQEAVALAVSKGLMTAEMAKTVWGVDEQPEPTPEPEPVAKRVQVEAAPPKPAPRRVCVVEADEQDMARFIDERIQKAKGRIYLA